MKLAVTVAEDTRGNWHAIALPDKAIRAQKDALKDMKVAGGLLGKGKSAVQFKRAIMFDTYAKRVRFSEQIAQPE